MNLSKKAQAYFENQALTLALQLKLRIKPLLLLKVFSKDFLSGEGDVLNCAMIEIDGVSLQIILVQSGKQRGFSSDGTLFLDYILFCSRGKCILYKQRSIHLLLFNFMPLLVSQTYYLKANVIVSHTVIVLNSMLSCIAKQSTILIKKLQLSQHRWNSSNEAIMC